jgi:hypothetical protein
VAEREPAKTPARGRGLIIAAGIIVAVVVLYVAGVILYNNSQNATAVSVATSVDTPDRIDAAISTSTVDPIKGDLGLRVVLVPAGAFAAGDGLSLASPVNLQVNSSTGKSAYSFKAGERFNPVDVVVSLDDAGASTYPFDKYNGEFLLEVTAAAPATGSPPPSGTAPPAGQEIPVALTFFGGIAGYSVDATHNATKDATVVDLAVSVARAPVTKLFAIGVLVLQIIIAIGALSMGITVFLGRRKAELAMLTWCAALLFAITPLRNAMPGAPPIGILVDVLVYFWVVASITTALVLVITTYMRQTRIRPPTS